MRNFVATPRVTGLRVANMAQRRVRILDAARRMLVAGGIEGLNLRALATSAGVTVPTIYNLVGNKEDLIASLFTQTLVEVEARMAAHVGTEPLELAEAVVTESTGLYAEDEDYYRTAFIAIEHLNQSSERHHAVADVYQWGERLTTAGCLACQQAGLLRGDIAPSRLGQLILRSYRVNCRAWAFRQMTLTEFRDHALADVYITLAADAVASFRNTLIEHVRKLTSPGPSRPQTTARQHERR